MRITSKRATILLLFAVVAPICFVGASTYYRLKSDDEKRKLNYAPYGMSIVRVLYVKEESWGIGPGGNESGVIVYEMPESEATKVANQGISYFDTLPQKTTSNKPMDWQGIYRNWKSTPLEFPKPDANKDEKPKPRIDYYLNKYGFGIPLDASIEKEINAILSEPGSYYASGRVGVILIAPKNRKIIYFYAG